MRSGRFAKTLNLRISNEIFLIFYSVLMFFNLFTFSYFGLSGTESFSFAVSDGWCPNNQGVIGSHCFGDFFYLFQFANLENPYNGKNYIQYPPFAIFSIKPFVYLSSNFGPQYALGAFVLPILALTFLSANRFISHISSSKKPSGVQRFMLLISMAISTPMIISLDRGNSIILVLPLIFLYLTAIVLKSNKQAIIFSSLITILKPQLAILGLLRIDQPRKMLQQFLVNATALCATFLLYPNHLIETLIGWASNTLKHNQYGGLSNVYPVNLTLTTFFNITRTFFVWVTERNLELFIPSSIIVIGASSCILFFLILGLRKKPDSLHQNYVLIVCSSILIGGTTFHYYLILLLPAYLMYQMQMNEQEERSFDRNVTRTSIIPEVLLYFFCLLPIAIPLTVILNSSTLDTSLPISIHWSFVTPIIFLAYLSLLRTRFKMDK